MAKASVDPEDRSPEHGPPGIVGRLMLFGIAVYRRIGSPILGGHCRFEPSCSIYAREAIQRHGARRGGWLAIKRLGRCRPGGGAGFDPVPSKLTTESTEGHGGPRS